MKKFLSLVLALVMTMSLVTVSAGAKDFTDSSKITYSEAVDVMSAVKVIDGYAEGDFRPTATLTRGAAAKIICNLILGPTTASALVADAAPYKDVPTNHTFAGYIAYCQKEGIISGYADGTFKPANSLTGYAFMKMLLGALGYDAEVEGYTGPNWSVNVAKRALNIGLADDLIGDFNGVKAVNREEACLYALNTLTADMVEYDAKTTVSTNGTTVVIAGSKAKEMVNNGNTDGKIFGKDGVMQFAEKYFDNLTVKKGSDDFSRPANVWKLKAEEIGTYTNTADATYTKKVENGDIYKDLGLGSKIAAKDVSVYVDGAKQTNTVAIEKGEEDKVGKSGNGVLTEVFYDDDADTVTVTQINTYVGEINKTVKATDKKDAYVVVTGEGTQIPESGFKNEFETDEKFEDDAYVLYTYSVTAHEIKSVEAAKKVEGTVTVAENDKKDTDEKKALTIDGTRYKAAVKCAGEDIGEVSVKQDYTIYLDSYGYMIYVEENEEIGDYALVLQTAAKSDFVGKKAELLFTDGTTKVVTTEKNYSTGSDKIADNTIVTYKVDSDGVYTLRKVDSAKASYVDNSAALALKNDKAGIAVDSAKVNNNTGVVTANSATVFVVRDTDDTDDYTAYTGIKNAPSIDTTSGTTNATKAGVYYYCKSGKMVTVMFIMPGANVNIEDESSNALFLAVDSVSNLIHTNDGDYYEFEAVVNGEIKTVKVDCNVKVVAANGTTTTKLSSADAKKLDGLFKGYSVDKYGIITTLREYPAYDGTTNDGNYKNALTGVGVDKVSKEYTVILDSKNHGKDWTITCDDDMKVYYADKDGKITESSYNAIAVDENDRVYAVVQDYLVKTLVICEVPAGKVDNTNVATGESYTMRSTVASNGNYRVQVDYTRPSYVPASSTVAYTFDILEDGMWFKTVTGTLVANKTRITDTGSAFNPDCELTIANVKFTPAQISVKYIDETTKADVTKAFTATGVASTAVIANDGTGAAVSVKLPAAYTTGTGFVVSNIVDASGKATTETKTAALSTSYAVATSADVIPAADDFVVVTVKGLAKAPVTYDVKVPATAVDGVTLTGATGVAAGTGVAVKAQFTDATVYGYLVSIKGVGEKLVKTGVNTTIGVITVTDDVEIKAADVTVTKIAKMALNTATADTKNWSGNKIILTFTNNVDETSALATDSIVVKNGGTAVDANIVVDGNNVILTVAGTAAAGWTVEVKNVKDAVYADNAIGSSATTLTLA